MNELIKEAEKLYKQIDNVQLHLVNSRLNNNDKGKKSAIFEMETAMCNTMQLLKCFIDRKDNIVDLGEVWHWYKDIKPCNMDDLCIFTIDGVPLADIHNMTGVERFIDYCFENEIAARRIRWAYLEDLLPKGGD